MPTVHGNHHLTMSVGPAQEDYDFHTRTLGMRSVKKTILFDGALPIYHLYYANAAGDPSSVLTTFPFRQAGLMGRRGTNQVRTINLSVPAASLGWWEGRLAEHGLAAQRADAFGTERLAFAHPCGIPYALVGVEGDAREGHAGGGVPAEHAIHGAFGVTVAVREPGEMVDFLELALGASRAGSGPDGESFEVGADGHGRRVELVEQPDGPAGTWRFGEGTVHHVAFDAGTSDNQLELKAHIEGLGYTDVSDVKDRQYFHSCYVRTPGGPLFELAVSVPKAWAVDEAPDELGREFMLPPVFEHRRAELLERLETIDTATATA
jgi:glyoxalase family protein